MSWLYSQALVAAYLEDNSLDGEPCAPLNTMPMPQAFLSPDRMTAFSRPSRFGMTFGPLTDDLGEAVLMWFLAGFPARTSAPPAKVPGLPGSEAACGKRWPGSLARYDHNSLSWKTCQLSLFGGLTEFSGTWPRWGMMRGGVCWEQTPLVPPSTENGCGYWHTPTTRDAKGQSGKGNRTRRGKPGKPHIANLCDQLVDVGRQDLVRSVTFRQWLMGWPEGWTSYMPLATDKFRRWQQQHGGAYASE